MSEKRKKPPAKPPDDPEQSRRFEEAAKQAEVDGEAFERAMAVIVPAPKPTEDRSRPSEKRSSS